MKAYLFDEHTKEYVSEIEAQIDPLETLAKGEDIYLLPANASFELPLEPKEGNKIIFDNGWKYVAIPAPQHEPEPTEEDITQIKIEELKTELAKSDYIDNKFIEAIVKNDMILLDTLKVKYKDKLEERQAIRNRIDELEEILNG